MTTGYRVLVVDDEPLAREVVVDLLRRDQEVAGVTETGNSRSVPGIIAAEHPDIVFLDIEMPGLSGLEIAATVDDNGPILVFVTAFAHYAVNAFDVEATDYLLKPFSDERFFEALDRAKRRTRDRRDENLHDASLNDSRRSTPPLTRLAVGHGLQAISIDLADIVWIEAEDYYVRLHTKQGRHLARIPMATLEERLDPRRFVRSHRAAIVNINEIVTIDADRTTLALSDGTHIAISRSRRPAVERAVGSTLTSKNTQH